MRLAFVVNRTRCSSRRLIWLKRQFAGMDATFDLTGKAGDGIYLARRAAERGYDMIVAVGGDGTVNEVVNGLCDSPAALGIIPCGTANDFAVALGIPSHPSAAAEILVHGRFACTGLGRANDRYFVSGGGIGLAATALACANRLRSRWGAGKLGTAAYVLGLMQALFAAGNCETRLDLEHAGSRLTMQVQLMLVGRVPTLGRRFYAFPGADPRGSGLALCRFDFGGRRWSLVHTLAAALRGHHVHHAGVTLTSLAECTLTTDEPMLFFADGEFWEPARHIHLAGLPAALTVCVPRSGLTKRHAQPHTQKEGAAPAYRGTAPGTS